LPKFIFTNNASGTLLSSITATNTALQVQSGEGAEFPAPAAAENTIFHATLIDVTGSHEIVECTSRTGDVLTVRRAQNGTAARSWSAGTRVEHRLTGQQLQAFLQKAGGVMNGDIDMDGKRIRNVGDFTDGLHTPVVQANTIRHEVDTANNWGIHLRENKKPDVNGDPILLKSDLMGLVFMWSGSESSLNKTVWKLCDGSNGTPDLRDRFILGAGTLYDAGQKVPSGQPTSMSNRTGEDGSHDHQGRTENHTLTLNQIPAHSHTVPMGGEHQHGSRGYTEITDYSNDYPQTTGTAGGGAAHSHNIPMGGAHTHTITPPPFYVLCYVMLR
jgi:hypothetical protein